ncbi:MAG: hypothetical protein JXQ23_12370 [Clostridia bacterium]|nr:hypothetical protein [Clostridia bacterium]
MIAYYYIKKEETEETSDCGLKLSKWCDTEIIIDIFKKKAITAYLTPKDNIRKYMDPDYDCLKLELNDEKAYIVENVFFETGHQELYLNSVIPARQYKVGMYRKPAFTITYTVLGEFISVLDKNRDIPILFENDEEQYLKTLMAKLENEDTHFYDRALHGYFENNSQFTKIESDNKKYSIYESSGQHYIIRMKR